MFRYGAGSIVCLVLILVGGAVQVAQAQQAGGKTPELSVAELRQDITVLGIINYMNPTVEQMEKMAQIVEAYRKVVDAQPPAEVMEALKKTRDLLIKGASRQEAEQQAGLAQALGAYAKKIDDARNQALAQMAKLLTEQQRQALSILRTPYQYFQQLVWEIGSSRAMSEEEWKNWAEQMAKRLSTSRRGQPLMSAAEAQQYLQRVRGMNDEQWAQEAAALYQRLVERLPQRMRQMLDSPRAAEQRVRRSLQAILDNPRSAELLRECIKADQAAGQK